MKYISYIISVPLTLFGKLFGLLWFFVALPFRGYARSVVHNYTLKNGIACKRLMERMPTFDYRLDGYVLKDVHQVGKNGFIQYRDVTWLEYQFALWFVWGWLDDDANEDTFAKGHSQEYIDGKRKFPIFNDFVVNRLKKEIENTTYGNTFDLGDIRAENKNFGFWSALIWNTRNTTQNFAYLLDVTNDESKTFKWTIGKFTFGWEEDGAKVDGVQYYIKRIGLNY